MASFMQWVATQAAPEFFGPGSCVLEIGAGDASMKDLLGGGGCEYTTTDLLPCKDIDVVCKTAELDFKDRSFDAVVSRMCFHADEDYQNSITKVYNMLRPGGLFAFTVGGSMKPGEITGIFEEHGVSMDDLFTDYAFYQGMCFVGVKRSESACFLPEYPDASQIVTHGSRFVVYIACPDEETADDVDAKKAPWARIVLAPATFFGDGVGYHHLLPSRTHEWAHADFVGIVRHDAVIDASVFQKCAAQGAEIVAFDAEVCDMVGIANEAHPRFKSIWDAVITELGFADPSAQLDIRGPWISTPTFMRKFIALFIEFKRVVETLQGIQASVWTDSLSSGSQTVTQWGVNYVPYHPVLAAKLAGFYAWVSGARVIAA